MDSNKSSDEVEQEYIQAMGSSLGSLYNALHKEVVWLHAKWLEYRKLYAESKERINLLNDTAAFFFHIVQDVLWEDVLLHIARLTDSPKQGKFENLTLRRLPDKVPDEVLANELDSLVKNALKEAQFARKWRDKRLAHIDLSHAIDVKATTLPGVSRQHIEDVLAKFREIMNCLHCSYLNSEVKYELFCASNDADALVYHLAVAARADKRLEERLRQGELLPEDTEPPP